MFARFITILAFILAVASGWPQTRAAAQQQAQPVHDLRYGEALYDFFQGQYFRSITDILVAQARAPITEQGADPELLLGSLYLSYGLDDAAEGIFRRLLQANASAYTHDLAWFYLGRMRYMNGQYSESLQAFKAMHDALPESREAERLHYMVNAYLREGRYDAAIAALGDIRGQSIWDLYARYNLGIALIRDKRDREGIDLLNQLGQRWPGTEEENALRDKANIALGYTALRDPTTLDPIAAFSRVRLNGPFSNQALLGIGWAYNEKDQPQDALKPWLELSGRSRVDSASQQALIAIAYTLEHLQQRKLALSYYDYAIKTYDRIRAELDKAINDVDYGKLLDNSIPASYSAAGQWTEVGLTFTGLPAAEYLDELMTSRDFQRAYRDYRDLNYIRLQVANWREKIPLLRTMLEERRRQYNINLAHVQAANYAERLAALRRKREQLAGEIAAIAVHEDARQLATAEEWERLRRFQDIEARLNKLRAQGYSVTTEDREYRILYGLTQWQLHTEFPVRLWRVKKHLHELDRELTQGTLSQADLENILKISPLNFAGFSRRIIELQGYITELDAKLDSAVHRQSHYCSQLIVETLMRKRAELDKNRSKALYAQARLYDQLSHEPAETP